MILYGHPFSSYTWKAQIALYEKGVEHEFRLLGEDAEHWAELRAAWPVGQFPLLKHGDKTLFEASIIVEYIDQLFPNAPHLIPADPQEALAVRLLDRVFDNHLQSRFQAVVSEHLPFITDAPDPARVARAEEALEKAYGWLEMQLAGEDWPTADGFTLADCAAAPALFYADWVHPIPEALTRLKDYRARLLARPSVARCVDDARPYRSYFPLGAPDRD